MTDEQYDFSETLADLDAGVFLQQIGAAIREVALGVVEHDKKGKVILTFDMKRIGESHQVNLSHTVDYLRPTRRGNKREVAKSGTVLHVGRGGKLSIMPDTQTDMFKAPKGAS